MKILISVLGVAALAIMSQPAAAALFGGPDAVVPVIGCPVVPPPEPSPAPAAAVEQPATIKKVRHVVHKPVPKSTDAVAAPKAEKQ